MFTLTRGARYLSGVALLLLTQAIFSCGQDPAFTESEMTASSADGSPWDPTNPAATGETDTAGSRVGSSSDGGTKTGGSSTGGGSSSGGTTAGGGGSVNPPLPPTPPPYVPPPGYPANTPKDQVLVEDGGTMALPGVKALKVGVNFEDLSDFDRNDSVLCFTGGFKVNGRTITSYKRQTIVADVWNNSACGHFITVQIRDTAGNITQSFKYNDRVTTTATMNFDVGSTLFVIMENFANSGCIGPIGSNHPDRAEVAPNLCRR